MVEISSGRVVDLLAVIQESISGTKILFDACAASEPRVGVQPYRSIAAAGHWDSLAIDFRRHQFGRRGHQQLHVQSRSRHVPGGLYLGCLRPGVQSAPAWLGFHF
jgi:hypothetical protein